jgi:cyanophycin synthetase
MVNELPADALPSLPCFGDSRRLTGINRYFAQPAVILEPLGEPARDHARCQEWQRLVTVAWRALGWDAPQALVHAHTKGVYLVASAPWWCLFTATEVNEWAWERASGWFASEGSAAVPTEWVAAFGGRQIQAMHPVADDVPTAARYFAQKAAAERREALVQLELAAKRQRVSFLLDDTHVSVGSGRGSSPVLAVDAVANAGALNWPQVCDVPRVLVTGSNGKTTTARLIAAIATHAGHVVGLCGTEGVTVGGRAQGGGDYSGPAGARQVLRDARVGFAVLETARGGIARRGLAMQSAEVAVVTNISADHFGEYGIDSLDDLATTKLVVAQTLGRQGTLVLNADDPILADRLGHFNCRIGLFSRVGGAPLLDTLPATDPLCAYLVEHQLVIRDGNRELSIGDIRQAPLAVNGIATHNVENLLAACLASYAAGIPLASIQAVLATFGVRPDDNPGRLERYRVGEVTVIIDYAHNPEGYAALIHVARAAAPPGSRVGIMLGHAGNRTDDAIADVAATIARHGLDRVVVKEIPAMLRGREPGEIQTLLEAALKAHGQPLGTVSFADDEVVAARALLAWSQPGDVVLLPVHQGAAREAIRRLVGSGELTARVDS